MTCLPAKNLLESYLDDELDVAQTAHVAEHLASCTSCAGVHAQLLRQHPGPRALLSCARWPARAYFGFGAPVGPTSRPASRPILAQDGDRGRRPARSQTA